MTAITPEQKRAVAEAGDSPVELADPQTGVAYVLVRADVYQRMRDLLEEGEDHREREAWARLARGARDQWARENAYLMIKPGEIYLAETEAGKRPAIIVSREELNRGRWVVAAMITSAHFAVRSTLPHCVPFRAGEYGLTKNCVAQAETITYLSISDLDIEAGILGVLDEVRMRDLIKAIGKMMGSECEPE